MHAADILQKCFAEVSVQIHAARWRVLSGAVLALLSCRRLVLMDLARAWPLAERVRGPLKKLDRLLSNAHLQRECTALYGQMARWSVREAEPIIVVDWSVLKADESWQLLRAGVVRSGRVLTVYEEVHPQSRAQSPKVHRAFLKQLKALLPSDCRPIIVTDAGFRCPWFAEVQALQWRWVGRVRNQVCVKLDTQAPWQCISRLMDGVGKLRAFGAVQLVRKSPFACQLLRYRAALMGRKDRTVRGKPSCAEKSRAAARAQREPWLLAYCNELAQATPEHIVNVYKKRMQIEQSFRDLKSERYGCAFRHSLTRKGPRLAVLLLLQAMASLVAWLQGLALHSTQHTEHCYSRKLSQHAHYSILRIGWESIRRNQPPPPLLRQLTVVHVPRALTSYFGLTP